MLHSTVRAALFWVVAFVALVGTAGEARAQTPPDVLLGRVLDADGLPVVGAEVRVGSVSTHTTTDSNGLFRITDMPHGLFSLGVRYPGYYPTADLLRFPGRITSDLVDVLLEPLDVDEKSDTAQVQAKADAVWGRELRRFAQAIDASRVGMVMTAEDIKDRQPIWTSDLFMRTPGFRVVGGGASARVLGGRGQCVPSVYLDEQLARGFQVNDIPPEYIRLMVVYRGVGTVPARFQNPQANANCGTIALYLM